MLCYISGRVLKREQCWILLQRKTQIKSNSFFKIKPE